MKASFATAGALLVGCGQRGCATTAAVPRETRRVDVVVVGAGLSGLMTAREMLKGGVGSVLVLEARQRVGGLTVSQPIADGIVVDGGGQWVGDAHTRILALAKELGVETTESYASGVTVFYFNGVRMAGTGQVFDGVRMPGTGQIFTLGERDELRQVRQQLTDMAAELPIDAPWDAPRATVYDELSVFNWLRDHTRFEGVRQTINYAINFTFGAKPEDLSLLCFLVAIRGCGGLEKLLATSDAQDRSFMGGSQRLSLKMAEELGDRVILGAPVRRIVDDPGGPLRVETDHLVVEASRVVVAMMPADTRRIRFEPRLPKLRRGLARNWTGAPDYKVHVAYKTPFWRDLQLSGTVIADSSVVDFVFDSSPSDGSAGVLLAFGAGEELPSDVRSRRDAVTAALATYFGDEALTPTHFVEMDWMSEEWSTGCASPLKPQVLSVYGRALRAPVGRIHWAGTETSSVWNGFMEGAVRSGERVASEVIAALREGGMAVPVKAPESAPG
ncbi:flavin monoamine oxidase family protein [Chondromyces apiculatus]|uniref:Amine oxidase [flavin-containing] A n=1 Tax=Chondromyces apiculatus DSM 436 TaxID=1192034 RepID=A0A017SUY7_9BACT|nr:FAD-dependent oxidoreductase [Chondromyces apiculatus]EYF00542.1 Amine oxidase [flavin-containing] A [Chondromyces apiculatus DSM 436]